MYDDKVTISVKMRFRTEINNAGNTPGVKNKSFKGRFNAQIKRDKKKSEDFKIERRVTRSQFTQGKEESEVARGKSSVVNTGESEQPFCQPHTCTIIVKSCTISLEIHLLIHLTLMLSIHYFINISPTLPIYKALSIPKAEVPVLTTQGPCLFVCLFKILYSP